MKICTICRKFTIHSQTTDNQILELKRFLVNKIFTDESISEAK